MTDKENQDGQPDTQDSPGSPESVNDAPGQEKVKQVLAGAGADNETGLESADNPAGNSAAKTETPGKKNTAGTLARVVFNVLLLGAIGVTAYMVYEQQMAVDALFEQQNDLASQRNTAVQRLDAQDATINALQSDITDLENALVETRQENVSQIQEQAATIDRLQNELVSTRLRITSNNPGASQEWLLAEAASLLRLAQQHLVVAKSVRTAQALFIAADDVLKQIDDPAIFSVREILAGELAAIRSVTEVDVQDIYLRLGAVAGQVRQLQVDNDLAIQIEAGEPVSLAAENTVAEEGMIAGLFSNLRATLDNYFVVRRRDVPIEPLMTPGQESALMQSVLLQIEQGRSALLQEEQEIYAASLGRARDLVEQFFSGAPGVKADVLSTLDTLMERRIVTEPPPLTRTRAALEQILVVRDSQPVSAGEQ